jgi:hypothetical protein
MPSNNALRDSVDPTKERRLTNTFSLDPVESGFVIFGEHGRTLARLLASPACCFMISAEPRLAICAELACPKQ